ncbi:MULTISPECIES: hypothetical protein [Bacillaceae]|uniref:hypothetical protein n=1 Tax=Bacillaceae TaxID=186817 RepID=UPI0005AA2831|nr:hypothetical protein [Bacillus rubiinfantis]
MSTVKRNAFQTLLKDCSYLCLKTPVTNMRFFVVIENGTFYRVDGKSLVITVISHQKFLHLCVGSANGMYKVEGIGQYGNSIFKNNEKKEVM